MMNYDKLIFELLEGHTLRMKHKHLKELKKSNHKLSRMDAILKNGSGCCKELRSLTILLREIIYGVKGA